MLHYLKADAIKMRRQPLQTAHICIPIVMAGIFTAYYKFSTWDTFLKIEEFYRVLGMGFPFLIGLFCTMSADSEKDAGGFQNMLMVQKKYQPFLSKLMLLLLYAFGALLLTAVLFGAGMQFILGVSIVSFKMHLILACVLFVSTLPLYILHMFLAFRFDKGVSIGLGIVETLLSALLRTGGANFWTFLPPIWPVRIVSSFMEGCVAQYNREEGLIFQQVSLQSVILSFILLLLYIVWAVRWEGKK